MKKLVKTKLGISQTFIQKHARPLDIALFQLLFHNASEETFLAELKKFQNNDGGFGYGLEPDFRTPLSSNMATTCAFQYLDKAKIIKVPNFIKYGVEYLVDNYNKEFSRWIPIPEKSNNAPHAIWWNYNLVRYQSNESWGNPTVEIIGYLLKYDNTFDKTELARLKDMAIDCLLEAQSLEVHELMCYERFAKSLSSVEQKTLFDKITFLAQKQVERDQSKWNSYVSSHCFL